MSHEPHPSIAPLVAVAVVVETVPGIEHRRRGSAIRCQVCDVTYLSWDGVPPSGVSREPGPDGVATQGWVCERCTQERIPPAAGDSPTSADTQVPS
ncbi:MAG TPA: hypothetical protein VG184_02700 [Acidimicrobiales bacterium]|jgi:hypothetical protein|nr:hypothetical protein [Acidimicrobiales bacterium]